MDPFGAPLPNHFTAPQQRTFQAQQTNWNSYGAFGTPAPTYEQEPPILEELGIDLGAIVAKSRSVLLCKLGSDSLKDVDMGGPLIFASSLAALHLLSGKLHFGIILGWSAVAFTLFWFLVHQLAGFGSDSAKECIDLYNCSACLGYCLLPLVVMNVVAIFLPHASWVVTVMFVLVSALCAFLAGKLTIIRAPFLRDQLPTIAFPAFLYYITVALLSLY